MGYSKVMTNPLWRSAVLKSIWFANAGILYSFRFLQNIQREIIFTRSPNISCQYRVFQVRYLRMHLINIRLHHFGFRNINPKFAVFGFYQSIKVTRYRPFFFWYLIVASTKLERVRNTPCFDLKGYSLTKPWYKIIPSFSSINQKYRDNQEP